MISLGSNIITFSAVIVSTTAMTILAPENIISSTETDISSSIKYWDIDDAPNISETEKAASKKQIIDDLSHDTFGDGESECICPKILLPYVCDTNGDLHVNVCKYHCSRRASEKGIKPSMIMTETSLEKSRQLCHAFALNAPHLRGSSNA